MIEASLSPLLTTMLCPLAISLMAPFLLLVRAESVEEEQGDPYYGVPLGAMHYSAEGTSAEVYAADEFSIIFNHFYHNPREPGCTAMMIGPPRPEDQENVVAGHGILLPLAHPPVAARHRLRRRRRRGATALQGYWPVEFGHLLMGPREEEGQRKSAPKTPKEQPRAKAALPGVLNRVNLSEQSTTEQLLLGNGWALDSQSIPTAATFLPDNGTSTEAEEVMMQSSQQSTEKSITATATLVQQEMANTSASSSMESTMEMSTTSASSDISSDVLSLSGAPASSADSPAAAVSPAPMAQPLILLGGRRSSAAQLQQLKMIGSKEEQQLLLRLEGAELRRAPARHNANSEWGGAKANELDEKGVPPPTLVGTAASTAGPTSSSSRTTTTPLFWVIKDPREGRRQRLIELRKKLDPNYEPPTTSTTAAPFSPLEAQFELPRIRDKLATFALTNGAKITQYKWIGLWNQCTKRKIPLVSLRDVDPPTEEKIMPLSGWSHNVTSYRIHVLNCNTILVPSFHYDGRNATRNTYFFIGVGQFPEAVEHQIKVNVVGQRKGEPLRSYSGEDVLLRLPRPYRTFDIDFISIFNTDEQKSFGHVIIPSLLVPPCPEEE